MKKYILGLGISALLVSASVAYAHPVSVSINTIDGQDASSGVVTLMVSSLPVTVPVAGNIGHADISVNSISLFTLEDNGVEFYNTNPSGDTSIVPFSADWTITTAGTHLITGTAKHGNVLGTDSVDVDVTIDIPVQVIQCPAAPSVATHYLKNLNIKAGSKVYKNVVSLVANHMGPQTNFDGYMACDAGYAGAVHAFVNANMTVTK